MYMLLMDLHFLQFIPFEFCVHGYTMTSQVNRICCDDVVACYFISSSKDNTSISCVCICTQVATHKTHLPYHAHVYICASAS